MVDDDYAARLSLAMGAGGDRPSPEKIKALAAKLGVTYQAVAKLWTDTSKMFTARNNALAARHLKVDSDWLATGEGEMRSSKVWPFGDTITPKDFFSLDPAAVQPAVDVIAGALQRRPSAPATVPSRKRQPPRAA